MSSCVAMAIELKTEIPGPRNREIDWHLEKLDEAMAVGAEAVRTVAA
jgi:hypothetical protein